MINSNKNITIELPLKIFVTDGIVHRVEDAKGAYVRGEIWDADIDPLEPDDESIQIDKTDKFNTKHHVYEP